MGLTKSVLWQMGDRQLLLNAGETKIAGILNITQDSFSDGGQYWGLEQAILRGCQMAQEGAALIDIGANQLGQALKEVTAVEEIERILPVLLALKDKIKIPISIDTDKPEVAHAALAAGAHLINDESGGCQAMARVIAKHQVPVILMHWPKEKPNYQQVARDVAMDLEKSVAMYEANGVKPEHIMIDPGLGFAKNQEENLAVLAHLDIFHTLNKPVLIGASRKSFIGRITGEQEASKRLAGSLAVAIWCSLAKIQMIRVHDVKATAEALAMTSAMMKG